jgi:predicted PurR-regulated permease PerM
MIRASGDVSGVSLAVLAVLAVIFALDWGSAVCIPVMLALMISYALSPVVNQLHQWQSRAALGPRWCCSVSSVGSELWHIR